MKFTDQGKVLLKRLEARGGVPNLTAYQDDGGVWTIGYGHTGSEVAQGTVWTAAQCESQFTIDCSRREGAMANMLKFAPVNDNQFSALMIFAYNIGLIAFSGSTALRMIQLRQFARVPEEIQKWIHVKGKVNQGLVNRRAVEVSLWNTPVVAGG